MSKRDGLYAPDASSDEDDLDIPEFELTDDGDGLPDEVRAELAALGAAEVEAATDAERALAEVQAELDAQRVATRSAVSRYREALLAAEPDLPPDLVAGDTLEAVDASVAAARDTVAHIRARLAAHSAGTAPVTRGFPVGAPARGTSRSPMSSAGKIAVGLGERR